MKKSMFRIYCLMLFFSTSATTFLLAQSTSDDASDINTQFVDKVKMSEKELTFDFLEANKSFTVEIAGPDDLFLKEQAKGLDYFTINSEGVGTKLFMDGYYNVEITPNFELTKAEQKVLRYLMETDQIEKLKAEKELLSIPAAVHKYYWGFRIIDGKFVLPRNEHYGLKSPEDNSNPTKNLSSMRLASQTVKPTFTNLSFNSNASDISADYLGLNPRPIFVAQVFATDLIVQGSACVGFDCISSESFGFDTGRYKENNLRIHFDDTSASASFPSNDWRIILNDSSNGGGNYFAIEDSSAGRQVFRVDAGAPTNALRIDSQGDVGIGTSNPVVELHINDGDSPSIRLEQDGSVGFGSQTWDIAGNETNFFIRDVTNGSKLPFRIKPGADDNAIYIDSNSKVGLGTASPQQELHVVGNVAISGSILPVSDARLKKDIQSINNALETIKKIRATSYSFRTEEFADMNLLDGIQYGFIAQELERVIPTLVTNSNNPDKEKAFKRVNYTGLIPFLVSGMQEQQNIIEEQQSNIVEQQEEIDALKSKISELEELKAQVAELAQLIKTNNKESEEAVKTNAAKK